MKKMQTHRLTYVMPYDKSSFICHFYQLSGIRYSEELSLKRFIPPELLRRGLGYEADQAGPQNLPHIEVSFIFA